MCKAKIAEILLQQINNEIKQRGYDNNPNIAGMITITNALGFHCNFDYDLRDGKTERYARLVSYSYSYTLDGDEVEIRKAEGGSIDEHVR